jgi:L-gulonolactone oxidase
MLITLDRYARVLHIDPEQRQVTVQAGIRLYALVEALAQHGLALSNMGSIAAQSVAGALSTGTHGTGLKFGAYDHYVTAMRLITARGDVLELTAQTTPNELAAAKVSLGSLGIISTVTLQCEPLFNLRAHEAPADFAATLANYQTPLARAEHFRFWWFPHTQRAQAWEANRTTLPADAPKSRWRTWYDDVLIGNRLSEVATGLTSLQPDWIPAMNRTLEHYLFEKTKTYTNRYDRVLTFLILVKQYVMEYAIPVEHTRTALTQLQTLIAREKFKVHLPVEVRFAPASDAWLSMAHGRTSCYVGVIMYRPFDKTVPYEPYFRAVDELMTSFAGRPHWAKMFYRTSADFQRLYPRWSDFQKFRADWDPHGMFMNAALERIFTA